LEKDYCKKEKSKLKSANSGKYVRPPPGCCYGVATTVTKELNMSRKLQRVYRFAVKKNRKDKIKYVKYINK
jgi:hypothetical protein